MLSAKEASIWIIMQSKRKSILTGKSRESTWMFDKQKLIVCAFINFLKAFILIPTGSTVTFLNKTTLRVIQIVSITQHTEHLKEWVSSIFTSHNSHLMNSDIKFSLETSTRIGQRAQNYSILAVMQSLNIWRAFSSFIEHKQQGFKFVGKKRFNLDLVGSTFVAILHSNILCLSWTFAFQMTFHSWSVGSNLLCWPSQ